VLLPALVMGALAWGLPQEVFWITDGGNRYIQVQSFARYGPPAIGYPGRGIDPGLRFFPWAGHHFQLVGGRVVSYYLPYFALLSVPGFRLAGVAGIHLLPLAAAIATLCLFPLLLAEVGLADLRAPAILLLGIGTPLLFYGITFWEHSLAVCLALAAVTLLLRAGRLARPGDAPAAPDPKAAPPAAVMPAPRLIATASGVPAAFVAGCLLGLSSVLREEGYVLAAALLVVFPWVYRAAPPAAAFGAGWLVVMAPAWWFQHRLFGTVFGIHAAAYQALGTAAAASADQSGVAGSGGGWVLEVWRQAGAKLGDLAFFLFRFHPDGRLSGLLAVPFVLVLLAGLLRRRVRTSALDLGLLAAATAASATFVALLLADRQPVFDTLFTQGLLPHTPFLLLALLGLRDQLASPSRPARLLAAACVLFALLVVLPLHRGDVGILWGPRHFLAIYPMLAALALLAWRDLMRLAARPARRRALAVLAAFLALLCLVVEARGLWLLALKKTATLRLLEAVRAAPARAVVTDGYWLTEELAALYFQRDFFAVESDAAYHELLAVLERHGAREATVVLSRRYGRLSPAAVADVRRRAISGRAVSTPGVGLLDAAVVSVRLREP
jgi:hypothetical protein